MKTRHNIERFVIIQRLKCGSFKLNRDDDNAAHAWDYCILFEGIIYLIAWAIVCYRLAGPSTTSVLVTAIVPTLFLLLTAYFRETVGIELLFMKKHTFLPFVMFMILMISSCNRGKVDGLQRKVDSLNFVIKNLSVENAKMAEELSGYENSPENLCADIEQLLKAENLSKLVEIQRKLRKYHPTCSQLLTVNEYIKNIQEVQQKRIAEERAKRMQAVNILRKKYDDVSGMTWYFSRKAKSSGTYCQLYLGKSDRGDLFLRLQMQYHGESWIFFEQAYLSYDGNTKEIEFDKYKEKETEVSGGVWEWIDVNVDDDISFIKRMVNGKNVKWRLDGRYTETRKFSAQELAGMKEVLLAYDVLKNGK